MLDNMTDIVSHLQHAPNLRCRDEGEGKYLLYCPKTDEMHIIGEIEKQIFDLCADRDIDSIVEEASALLKKNGSDDGGHVEQEVFAFLQAMLKREILVPR